MFRFKGMVDSVSYYRELGRRLSALRTKRGMTQADVGTAIGTSRAWIANIEAGRQRMQLHQIYAVAGALGCKQLDELIPTAVPELEPMGVLDAPDLSEVSRAQIESLVRNAVAAARPKGRR